MFTNMVLRKIFGFNLEETGSQEINSRRNGKLHTEIHTRFWCRDATARGTLENLGEDVKIYKMNLNKHDCRDSAGALRLWTDL